jgi:hypothetical protein
MIEGGMYANERLTTMAKQHDIANCTAFAGYEKSTQQS